MKLLGSSHSNPPTIRLANQEFSDINLYDMLIVRHTPTLYRLLVIVDCNWSNFRVQEFNISKSFKTITYRYQNAINKDTLEKVFVCNLGNVPKSYIKRQFKQDFPEFFI